MVKKRTGKRAKLCRMGRGLQKKRPSSKAAKTLIRKYC